MLARGLAIVLVCVAAASNVACDGAPKATSADLVVIRQPTPDPTLDAVVRDLPRALAGVVQPTPTPTRTSTPVSAVPKVNKAPATATPTQRATPRPATP